MRRSLWFAAVAGALFAAMAGCSSDPDTPLGSQFVDDILGSKPGVVFQDTIDVIEDTVLAYATLLTNAQVLEVGRRNGYVRAAVLRADFSKTHGDENRVVSHAFLRMLVSDGDEPVVRFYQLANAYTEGDSMPTLATLSAIIDPSTNSYDRLMTKSVAPHELPKDLVQGWIRGDSVSNGIAIVYQDDGNERVAVFPSYENADTSLKAPNIQVIFEDGTRSVYDVTNDATFIRATTTPSNLIVSDGYLRRVWFHLDLSAVSDSSAVHSAEVRFNVVPNSLSGLERVELYIPDSGDPTSPSFLRGQPVIDAVVHDSTTTVEFAVTNALLAVLSGTLPDNGLVMRFVPENLDLRYVEFYSSAAGALRPRVVLTVSTPAGFHE